jgi:P27 family predicted phage terminase small subunit
MHAKLDKNMKGRKPIPNALKTMRGTDQPVRMAEETNVTVISKLPPPPKWLSEIGKKIYKNKGRELISQKVMATLDLDMFLLYCNEYAIYLETSEFINEVPLKAAISEGSEKALNRAIRKNQRAWERAKSIAIEFGFTPSSRSRIKPISGDDEMSAIEKFMRGMS